MSKKRKKKTKKKEKAPMAESIDLHVLYEESVQTIDFEIDFCQRVYRKERGRPLRRLREDFCGTAAVACAWAKRNEQNRSWGIDLDTPTLDWGREHHLARLGKAADRVQLIQGNVLNTPTPKADATLAMNFSCFIFKTRDQLREYFRTVYEGLANGGMMMMDTFGGQHAMSRKKDKRKIAKVVRDDGVKVPAYRYIWDQARFNAITHDILCHIHFRFSDGSRLDKAFTYDWRLWTLPEVQELLKEAGFKKVDVYLHGWDEDGESDDVYRRRTFYENELAWVAYIVALK